MAISLIQSLREIPFAFVDVETSGASADFGHRVIEMGIARVENGQVVGEYERLLDPQRRISAGVTALTGITQAMVSGQPTFSDELPRMLELLRGAVVVGHNVRFDLSFLCKEFRRCRCDIVEVLGDAHVLDTVRIARRRFGRGGNGLQTLCRRLGIVPEVAHRALADVRTTYGVFDRMLEPMGGWGMQLTDALVAQGGRMGLLPVNPRQSLLPLELEEALEMRRPVMMEYLDGSDQRTERMIEPLHVRRRNGELMLVAFCQLRQAQRTFKVERIVQLRRVGEDSNDLRKLSTASAAPFEADKNVCPTDGVLKHTLQGGGDVYPTDGVLKHTLRVEGEVVGSDEVSGVGQSLDNGAGSS